MRPHSVILGRLPGIVLVAVACVGCGRQVTSGRVPAGGQLSGAPESAAAPTADVTASPPAGTASPAAPAPVVTPTKAPSGGATSTVTASPSVRATPVPVGSCAGRDLAFRVGSTTVSGARTTTAVIVTDAAPGACTVDGWPAVDVVGPGGMQVGPAAAPAAGTAGQVTLTQGGPGAVFNLAYSTAGQSGQACSAQPADGLLVFPPGQSTAVQLPDQFSLCTDQADRPTVSPVRSGS